MYLFVIFSSLFNSLVIGLFGKWLGRQASIYLCLLNLIISCLITLFILYDILILNNNLNNLAFFFFNINFNLHILLFQVYIKNLLILEFGVALLQAYVFTVLIKNSNNKNSYIEHEKK